MLSEVLLTIQGLSRSSYLEFQKHWAAQIFARELYFLQQTPESLFLGALLIPQELCSDRKLSILDDVMFSMDGIAHLPSSLTPGDVQGRRDICYPAANAAAQIMQAILRWPARLPQFYEDSVGMCAACSSMSPNARHTIMYVSLHRYALGFDIFCK